MHCICISSSGRVPLLIKSGKVCNNTGRLWLLTCWPALFNTSRLLILIGQALFPWEVTQLHHVLLPQSDNPFAVLAFLIPFGQMKGPNLPQRSSTILRKAGDLSTKLPPPGTHKVMAKLRPQLNR